MNKVSTWEILPDGDEMLWHVRLRYLPCYEGFRNGLLTSRFRQSVRELVGGRPPLTPEGNGLAVFLPEQNAPDFIRDMVEVCVHGDLWFTTWRRHIGTPELAQAALLLA